jgi:hypothetical protein
MFNKVFNTQYCLKTKIMFFIIFFTGISLRFFYFPHELPLIADGMDYFVYSTEIVSLGHLPTDWTPINNGWSIFLSFWFSIINLENSFQYMQLDRIISIFLSALITIPVYFLCKKFFDEKIALVGSALFAFDPRILLNSLLGITEPLFILLGITSLVVFLKYQQKAIILSFILASFCTIVRSEGIFLFGILSILFFIKYKFSKEIVKTYFPCLIIFILILLPIMDYRTDVTGYDGIFQRVSFASNQIVSIANNDNNLEILDGLKLFITYFGWILIPNFLIFLPFGFIEFLKNRNKENNFILIFLIIYSLPLLYAYIMQAQDTRYFYFLFPIFSLISLFAVKKYLSFFQRKNLILFLIISSLLISSIVFYEFKQIDIDNEKEINTISKLLSEKELSLNHHPTISRYIYANEIPNTWPFIISDTEFKTTMISTSDFYNLEDFISSSRNSLTGIVVDENSNLPKFLQDVYYDEKNYPYLKKSFDSNDYDFNHSIKLFYIDYQEFDSRK